MTERCPDWQFDSTEALMPAAVTVAQIALIVLDIVRNAPDLAAAIYAWFNSNPHATPEDAAEELANYQQVVAQRRAEVARFNEGL